MVALRKGAGVLVAVAAFAAACGDPEPGVPAPSAGGGETTTPRSTTAAPTTASPPAKPTTPTEVAFNREQLCALLTPAEAARFGSTNPRPTSSYRTGNPQCQWGGEMSLLLDFGAAASGEVAQGPDVTNTQVEVAGLPATMQKINSRPSCQIILPLNSGRSTFVMGAAVLSRGEGKYEACDVAEQIAEIVVPKVKG